MKQSRAMSMVESIVNILVGFGISLGAQIVFLPMLGVAVSLTQNLVFALIMTAISIARSYLLRRLFEALHIRRPLTPAMNAVIAERWRQIEAEGWDHAHDDAHPPGAMSAAGGCYAIFGSRYGGSYDHFHPPSAWPWTVEWWKPRDFRRDRVRAAALIVADIERHDRAKHRGAN